ncbi:3-oxo-tetronate kinase [Arthrobacter sp. ISL-5]|uniref:3-oxo-tetronate kinase n=1 Tax=Arthrobacter sp. ISL-5 TaxID=2819111 RepID=UPI001BE83686|nr:3-oxo-tetronate kinase [Arthrobacter sp. ISL-5]MBT2555523.1 four-carbon acid sugar kinase family protein [Arthrobacter sp. ISL-5]
MTLAVGAIADDFTGALDLSNNLVRAGLRVLQINGLPTSSDLPGDVDAVVIALKSRTAPAEAAVGESRAALDWLRARGAGKYFIKYCSTFDSTPTGNIGPVIDAAMDDLGATMTIAAPAFPDAGRTVHDGRLFVDDVPLSESSMRTHPLTPMTDSDVVRLLTPQTRRRVGLVDSDDIASGSGRVRERLEELKSMGVEIAVVDTTINTDLTIIARAVADFPLVTGSSGLGLTLPAAWNLDNSGAGELPTARGKRAIVAGSVSAATNEQVALFNGPKFAVDPIRLMAGADIVTEALDWAAAALQEAEPILLYSTACPEAVSATQAIAGAASVGNIVEGALSAISVGLVNLGVGQLVLAGGETSGACVQALGIRELHIGRQIDPGVPWAYGESFAGPLHVALKSGNFGGPNFFTFAFEELT